MYMFKSIFVLYVLIYDEFRYNEMHLDSRISALLLC